MNTYVVYYQDENLLKEKIITVATDAQEAADVVLRFQGLYTLADVFLQGEEPEWDDEFTLSR